MDSCEKCSNWGFFRNVNINVVCYLGVVKSILPKMCWTKTMLSLLYRNDTKLWFFQENEKKHRET
jgi:hypothetical protein